MDSPDEVDGVGATPRSCREEWKRRTYVTNGSSTRLKATAARPLVAPRGLRPSPVRSVYRRYGLPLLS